MHEKPTPSDTHGEKQPGSSLESDPDLQAIRDTFDVDMAKMQSIDTSFSSKDHATQKQEDLKNARDEVNALYGETSDQPQAAETRPTLQPGSAESAAWQTAGDRPGRRVIVDPTLEGTSLDGISLGGREIPTQSPDRFNLEEHDQRYRPDASVYFASTPDEDPTDKEPVDGAVAAAEAAIQRHTEKQQDGEKPDDTADQETDETQQKTDEKEEQPDQKQREEQGKRPSDLQIGIRREILELQRLASGYSGQDTITLGGKMGKYQADLYNKMTFRLGGMAEENPKLAPALELMRTVKSGRNSGETIRILRQVDQAMTDAAAETES